MTNTNTIFGAKSSGKQKKVKNFFPSKRLKNYSMVEMIGSPDVLLSENMEAGRLSCKGSLETPTRPVLNNLDINVRRPIRYSSSKMIDSRFSRLGEGKLVIVEGNIGVGKTTLTQKLAADLDYKVFLEPSTDNPFLGICIS